MPIDPLITSFSGYAVRHLPDTPGSPPDPYNFSLCDKSKENRWNNAGDPTLYLAKDTQGALAEWSRHFKDNRTPGLAGMTYRRKVFRFQVEVGKQIVVKKLFLAPVEES